MNNHEIGIALAGGGTRGIAHIGVLQALEENGISPKFVSGASAGSIVGSLYAAGKSPAEILTIFKETSILSLFKPTLSTVGLADLGTLRDEMIKYIPEDTFESLERRMFIAVTNLSQGRTEIAHEGALLDWVVASSSIPILTKARNINGEVYVDGGVLNNLPIGPLKSYCRKVIGVNVSPIRYKEDLSDLMKIGYRTQDVIMWSNVAENLAKCDVAIEPDISTFGFFDVNAADEIYQIGYDTTMAQMPQILDVLSGDTTPVAKVYPHIPTQISHSPAPKLKPKRPIIKQPAFNTKSTLILGAILFPVILTGAFFMFSVQDFELDKGLAMALGATSLLGALSYIVYRIRKR